MAAVCTACGQATDPTDAPEGSGGDCLVVATSEFGVAGSIAVVDLQSLAVDTDVTSTHHDAWVRVFGSHVVVLNRQGADSLQVLDGRRGFATEREASLGQGANPWDLVATGADAGVALLYGSGSVQRVSLASGSIGTPQGEPVAIDPGGESDGRAELLGGFVWRDALVIVVQGLDEYPTCGPAGRARLVSVDPRTLEPVAAFGGASEIVLQGCNSSAFVVDGDAVWVATLGRHRSMGGEDLNDGAIERVDLSAPGSVVVADEAALGQRDPLLLISGSEGRMWVALADADFGVSVHAFTPAAESPLGLEVWSGEGIFDMIEQRGLLFVADRARPGAGLIVLDAVDPLGSDPLRLPTGYAPFDLAPIALDAGRCVR